LSAIFGIAGTYTDNDVLKMQDALAHQSAQKAVVKKFNNGFLGRIRGGYVTPRDFTERDSTVCVADGYVVSAPNQNDNCSEHETMAGLYAKAEFAPSKNLLHLYRDPSGARPLYYAVESNRCIFASRPKAILAVSSFARELNPAGVSLFLSMICPPDPITIYNSVKMLRPGFCLKWQTNQCTITRFWTPPPAISSDDTSVSVKQIAAELREALENSVCDAIPADYDNTGFFLSGGTDTGAVVALAAKAGIAPIRTFTIGYEGTGSGYDDYNEFHYARLISNHYKTIHHEFTISPETVIRSLPGIVTHLDQPSGDAINTYLVAGELPSEIHTVLTGTGGDELFIGSHWFKQQARLQQFYDRWRRIPTFFRRLLLFFLKYSTQSSARRIKRLNDLQGGVPAQYRHFKFLFDPDYIFTPEYRQRVDNMQSANQIVDMYDELHKSADDVNRMESLLFHHEVSNLQLRDVDSMSHAHNIEARSPLVDSRVLSVLRSIPGQIKAPDGKLRHLMFQALDDCLLMETRTRKKMSFIVPMDLWARRELRPVIEHLLSRDVVSKRGILNVDAVEKEKDAFYRTGRERHPFKVWNLTLLELWCRYHIDAPLDAAPPTSLDDLL
jgi:asparagine synthase (glutamine-hydrolysing)